MIEIDWKKFTFAVDLIRRARNFAWNDVADKTKIPASSLTRLKQGKQISANHFVTLLDWADLELKDVKKEQPK